MAMRETRVSFSGARMRVAVRTWQLSFYGCNSTATVPASSGMLLDYPTVPVGAFMNTSRDWAVVVAGGDGERLQSLTRLLSGDTRPKQFCRLLARHTLLGAT